MVSSLSVDSINLENSKSSVEELKSLFEKRKINETIPDGSSIDLLTSWRRRVIRVTQSHIFSK